MAETPALDAAELLAALARHEVDCVLIGGMAMQAYGHVRTTIDLDVFAVDQTAGAPRTYEELRGRSVAVQVLGASILIAHPEDLIRMKSAASRFRDRPEVKRRQDLDDIAVLERLRTEHGGSTRPSA